ncbi:hypothetical protein DJ90_5597 [Paenibacillus macerans]|uniref:Uncharacterized protein n=1 Tax=Paenibacillus macerans TaxID=44252 RepID=A0A090XGC7_PAEMA|nr:hypothetical protein DJ90_5597 [Paenibacillus macerans]
MFLSRRKNLSTIDPYFYADAAVSRMRFCRTVIDVGAERMKWNSSFTVAFRTGNFSTAETAADCRFDPFRSRTHRSLNRLFQRTTERNAAFQLLCDAFCDQNRVKIRVFDFRNVDVNLFAACDFRNFPAQDFHFRTAFTDNHARFGCVDRYVHTICRSLDFNPRYRGVFQFVFQVFTNFNVFQQKITKIFASVPFGFPITDNPYS